MVKEFNSIEEIKKYYNKEANTYVFKENGEYIDLIKFNFDLNIDANISACDIKATNISACDINAGDINAYFIDARDIDALDISAYFVDARDVDALDIKVKDIKTRYIKYDAICFAYDNITCNSISGKRDNCKHFVLDGTLTIKGGNNEHC